MRYSVDKQHFASEAEVYAEIAAIGYHAREIEVPAQANALHYHEFDTRFFIMDGGLQLIAGDTGLVHDVRPGDRIVASAGWIHREQHDGFRAIFGFSVDPATLTMPIDKPAF